MDISYDALMMTVAAFLLPFFRTAAMFMTITVIGNKMLPMTIRLLLSAVVAFAIMPMVAIQQPLDGLSLSTFNLVAGQIIIGVMLGFVMQMIFQIFIMAGQLVAMQAGLGFASMVDPQSGMSVPVVSQFYLMMISLLYLTFDGHLVMINMLAESFERIPIGDEVLIFSSLPTLVAASAWIFQGALLVALPAVVALLIVNFSFGIMTRSAPQLNIFTIGFPVTLLLGLLVLALTVHLIVDQFSHYYARGIDLARVVTLG